MHPPPKPACPCVQLRQRCVPGRGGGGKDVPVVSHGAKGDYREGSQTYVFQSLLTVSSYTQLWIHQK